MLDSCNEDAGAIAQKSVCDTVVGAIEKIGAGIDTHLKRDDVLDYTLHFLGAEDLEVKSFMNDDSLDLTYGPMFRSMESMGVKFLSIIFIGPNLLGQEPLSDKAKFSHGEMTIVVECHSCLYHNYQPGHDNEGQILLPNMVVMLNAGIWGYTSWLPTLDLFAVMSSSRRLKGSVEETHTATVTDDIDSNHRCENKRTPLFLVTSYTLEEAEDDEDTIRDYFQSGLPDMTQESVTLSLNPDDSSDAANSLRIRRLMKPEWLWEAELNPFKSTQVIPRKTKSEGREYYSNHAWQCFHFSRR